MRSRPGPLRLNPRSINEGHLASRESSNSRPLTSKAGSSVGRAPAPRWTQVSRSETKQDQREGFSRTRPREVASGSTANGETLLVVLQRTRKHAGGPGFESLPVYMNEAAKSDPRERNRWALIRGQKLGHDECPYLVRWAIETPFGSVRLHHWLASDDPRYRHDHPWWFVTLVLSGSYVDLGEDGAEEPMRPGMIRFRPALHRHTVKVAPGGCWTLLLTGPHTRFWGFWVNGKFRKSNRFFLTYGHHQCEGAPHA